MVRASKINPNSLPPKFLPEQALKSLRDGRRCMKSKPMLHSDFNFANDPWSNIQLFTRQCQSLHAVNKEGGTIEGSALITEMDAESGKYKTTLYVFYNPTPDAPKKD